MLNVETSVNSVIYDMRGVWMVCLIIITIVVQRVIYNVINYINGFVVASRFKVENGTHFKVENCIIYYRIV